MLVALTALALAATSDRRRRRARDCSVRSMAVSRFDMRDWCSTEVGLFSSEMARVVEEELKLVWKLGVELWFELWKLEELTLELLKLAFMLASEA